MPVEDLVKWVILRETVVNDVEELPSYVGFNAGVPWGVEPGDVSLAVSLLVSSRYLGVLRVVC